MEHLSCWGGTWATENKAWSLGVNPVCPVYLNIICEATFPRPILGAPKADGSWGEIPWGLPRGRTQTIHLFSFQAGAPQQDSALGQSNGGVALGLLGRSFVQPRPTASRGLWSHHHPTRLGPPQRTEPQSGRTPPVWAGSQQRCGCSIMPSQ